MVLLAPVLAVHAASKKFKVAVVVDTLEEKGRWQETFQVTLSLCDVVSFLSPLSCSSPCLSLSSELEVSV